MFVAVRASGQRLILTLPPRLLRIDHIPGVSEFTGQSNGLPTALPRPGELAGGGERPRAGSPDPGRAKCNPIDFRVISVHSRVKRN